MKNDTERRWYLTALATAYIALCSAGCLYYLSLQFRPNAGTVPVLRQALCLAFAVAAATYFMRARAGRIALTVLTVITLAAIGTAAPGASAFHLCVLLVLLIPILPKRNREPLSNSRADAVANAPGCCP